MIAEEGIRGEGREKGRRRKRGREQENKERDVGKKRDGKAFDGEESKRIFLCCLWGEGKSKYVRKKGEGRWIKEVEKREIIE